jgi:hypothetical protein
MKICDVPPGLHHLFDLSEPVVRPEVVAAARARIERDGSVNARVLAFVLMQNTLVAARMEARQPH